MNYLFLELSTYYWDPCWPWITESMDRKTGWAGTSVIQKMASVLLAVWEEFISLSHVSLPSLLNWWLLSFSLTWTSWEAPHTTPTMPWAPLPMSWEGQMFLLFLRTRDTNSSFSSSISEERFTALQNFDRLRGSWACPGCHLYSAGTQPKCSVPAPRAKLGEKQSQCLKLKLG